jgi:hypothetical protein
MGLDVDTGSLKEVKNSEIEATFEKLFDRFGVRSVYYGFGWIQKGNPATITFEEATKIIIEGGVYGV